MKNLLSLSLLTLLVGATAAVAQNPYLPLWEFIPDGEPYVFDDPDNPGKQRVYIYGPANSVSISMVRTIPRTASIAVATRWFGRRLSMT